MSNNSEYRPSQQGMLYRLKEHGLIQRVLIKSLLAQRNCEIEDIAMILQIEATKLKQVLFEEQTLSEKGALNLVSLFYISKNYC